MSHSDLAADSECLAPQKRAEARFHFIRSFDEQFSNWVSIAKCCVDAENDRDWQVMGYESFGKWLKEAAPRSRSYLYLAMARYKELIDDIPENELKEIPLGSAGILKQLSPAVRRQSKIRQAAKGKPSELRQILHEELPDQHIEPLEIRTLKFAQSQAGIFDEMVECYRAINHQEATAEEAVEWLASQWLDANWEENSPYSNREKARQLRSPSA